MKETLRHQEAFNYYYSLGNTRSIPQVVRNQKVSVASVKRWSTTFKWQERIVGRDEKNAKALAKKTDTKIVQEDAQNIKIARAAIKVFAQSLIGYIEHKCECGAVVQLPIPKAKLTADQFDKMVRLEKFIIGEEDSRAGTVINVNLLPVDPAPRAKPVESKEI